MPLHHREANLSVCPQVLGEELRQCHDHFTLGDLHGNALKLIYTLIEEGVLSLSVEEYDALRYIYYDQTFEDVQNFANELHDSMDPGPFQALALKHGIDRDNPGARIKLFMQCETDEIENVIESSAGQLGFFIDEFKASYRQVQDYITLFKQIIEGAPLNSARAISLIGDEFADRGRNDYLTLIVLAKLAPLQRDVMLSNHGVDFISAYERGFDAESYKGTGFSKSLTNMLAWLSAGIIDQDEVNRLIETHYLPALKAIGYTISQEGEVTVFTHAPSGLETIEALADKLKVDYRDAKPGDLLATIDAINGCIQSRLQNKKFSSLYDTESTIKFDASEPTDTHYPLTRLVWNRALGDEFRAQTYSRLNVKFVHGHNGPHDTLKNHQESLQGILENLDTMFGKQGETQADDVKPKAHVTRHDNDHRKSQLTVEILDKANLFAMINARVDEIKHKSRQLEIRHQPEAAYLFVLADELQKLKTCFKNTGDKVALIKEGSLLFTRASFDAPRYALELGDVWSELCEVANIAPTHATILIKGKLSEMFKGLESDGYEETKNDLRDGIN